MRPEHSKGRRVRRNVKTSALNRIGCTLVEKVALVYSSPKLFFWGGGCIFTHYFALTLMGKLC
jgi:hypothetical protein